MVSNDELSDRDVITCIQTVNRKMQDKNFKKSIHRDCNRE